MKRNWQSSRQPTSCLMKSTGNMAQLPVKLSMKEQWHGIMAIYFGIVKLTQKQLAQKIGKEQSYIARVEKGEADIQLSSFFRIARALGIEFTPTFI
jgi:DNA-binding XRE family transcriptional regulator